MAGVWEKLTVPNLADMDHVQSVMADALLARLLWIDRSVEVLGRAASHWLVDLQ